MPIYKDENTNTWYCKFYYEDVNGIRKQKMKRGFKLQREAKEWERNFLESKALDVNIKFKNFVEQYYQDISERLRPNTICNKKFLINEKIIPFFGEMILSEIKPVHVRQWQNTLLSYTDDNIESYTAFHILYYTGIRTGELLALTWKDIDFENQTINIDKSYHRIEKADVITKPKTPKSIRTIMIFDYLAEIIKKYKDTLYKPNMNDRVFLHTHRFLQHEMTRIAKKANVKKIRVHDLRHSHASLLIELGFSPLLIAERLGHEKVETTLNTYSHLYPNKQVALVEKLQTLVSN